MFLMVFQEVNIPHITPYLIIKQCCRFYFPCDIKRHLLSIDIQLFNREKNILQEVFNGFITEPIEVIQFFTSKHYKVKRAYFGIDIHHFESVRRVVFEEHT